MHIYLGPTITHGDLSLILMNSISISMALSSDGKGLKRYPIGCILVVLYFLISQGLEDLPMAFFSFLISMHIEVFSSDSLSMQSITFYT